MKFNYGLALLFAFILMACQPPIPSTITIIDDGQIISIQSDETVPSALLAQAGINFNANDRVLVNGLIAPTDQPFTNLPITHSPITIQLRRAINITLNTPDEQKQIESSAFTVGEALHEASHWLYAGDIVSTSLSSPVSNLQSPIMISPSQPITVASNGKQLQINSSARSVGEALAEAGIPLLGLDYSLPAENESLPADGQIQIVRVTESVMLAQKPIPFESEIQASAEVPLDQTQILQPGEMGLSMQRVRIRYENGSEVSRLTENETLVRPPKTRILGYGTKIEIMTAVVDGVEIEYWRALEMYATSYSPCRLGTGTCGSTTASGKQLRKGMVAVNRTLYFNLLGQQLFIPGYGRATIEDLCGGCVGKPWIDLGFTDANFEAWHRWVTVYFLTPVPSNVIYVIE